MSNIIKLIVGLGNPDLPAGRHGKKYADTYHNVGFLFIEFFKKNPTLYPIPYTLIASDVYMNESGRFVVKIIKKYGIKPKELLIIHDESDIILGKYKLSFGRGAAGHHGVESVQTALKTKDFWRLRIGIRLPTASRMKAEKFVLKKITSANKKTLEEVFKEAWTKIKNF